ncbi:e2cb8c7a-6b71-4cba-a482-675fd0a9b2df [Thermothielavioides terrestris]|uniref:chitinase n=1 Tax=Thermothielavioides terrestris TaxID=2587410 RepID=A0A3S4BJ53_9PEZI|nr:e2cb8c7a-6b71-4cba-a482-675fd0a9b2df [Thermothielavioides terrestris]
MSFLRLCLMLVLYAAGLITSAGFVSAQPPFGRFPFGASIPDVDPCPPGCSVAGPNPANWSVYHNLDQLQGCKYTLFYEFSLADGVIDDPNTPHRIYACTSHGADWANLPNSTAGTIPAKHVAATYEIGWSSGGDPFAAAEIQILSKQMRQYLASGYGATKRAAILFARLGRGVVGLYIGKGLQNEGVGSVALKTLEDSIPSLSQEPVVASSLGMQLCKPGDDGDHIFGFIATSNASFAPVQEALKSWSNAECLSFEKTKNVSGLAFLVTPSAANTTAGNTTLSSTFGSRGLRSRRLSTRGDCRTIQVVSGDGCASLASKCGISGADFMKYNPQPDLCSTLQPLQHVCCSDGTLPDFRPKPNPDGSCATYTVAPGDTCAGIAAANSLTVDELDAFNSQTWGWMGCPTLWSNAIICLSSGSPPMPAPLQGTQCGPQVPGTTAPPAGTDLGSLNPCPLNACCDIWGQCGTTAEFCTNTSTGAPGTAKPGTNGCISNCGTDVVRSDPPAVFRSIAYFEGFGLSRPCLYEDALQLDTSKYTHLHFAFAGLTEDFQVHFQDSLTEWEFQNFKSIRGPARILSIGGWDFSTDPSTYTIFRQGVTSANRLTLAKNIANFIISNNLDGVDIDWEYPGAPDIPDIPPDDKDGGLNYMAFLVVLKNLLPGKSVSIAAPASYWYLKAFPIAQMSKFLDYIVFMTYDLHGQWDAGGSWSQDGCLQGNCLRSHVNLTETINALSVPSNKVVVGVASYGRSFAMADAGCYTQDCFYLGDRFNSMALPGPCTATAGYISNAEIKSILNNATRVNVAYVDEASNSNILVYDDVQWVGWMSDGVKSMRTSMYRQLNMGGVTDWAADLDDFHDEPPPPSSSWSELILELKAGKNPNLRGLTPDGNWSSLTCDDDSMDAADYTPSQRWSMMDADDAWMDVIKVWKQTYEPAKKKTFSEAVALTVGVHVDVECGSFSETNNCDQMELSGCLNNNPASGEIWNSLVGIHQMYASYHQAIIEAAALTIDPALQDFENKFAPVPPPEDDRWLDFVLDLLSVGVGAVAKPFFEGYIATLPAFKGQETIVNHTEEITELLTKGVTGIAKQGSDDGGFPKWSPELQAEFSATLGTVLTGWAAAAEAAVGALFNGTDESINMLTTLISGGNFIDGSVDGTPESMPNGTSHDTQSALNAIVAKVFFAYAIPAVWNASGQAVFVMDTGFACGTVDPMGGDLSTDTMHATWGCWDNMLYYLVNPAGASQDCDGSSDTAVTCRDNMFSAPPGIDSLDGNTRFGGITVQDLIAGSVRTYIQNGRQNGGPVADPTNSVTFSDLYNSDITTPGFIRLPVCSVDMARRAWSTAGIHGSEGIANEPYYPCVPS